MFESIIGSTTADGVVYVKASLICVVASLIMGIIVAVTYVVSMRKKRTSEHFALALILVPAIVTAVILMVGSNVARAFSIAGIFALIRFRSVPGDAKDITFIFSCAAIGLANGMGYIGFAGAFTLIVCAAFIVFSTLCSRFFCDLSKQLKVVVPEDMNYTEIFDDLLEKYTKSYELERVKTTNLGSMYELTYRVYMNKDQNEKEFIDEIRCRNGNLNVSLCRRDPKSPTL